MRRSKKRIRKDRGGAGDGDFVVEKSSGGVVYTSTEKEGVSRLAVASIVCLSIALVIAAMMLLKLRQDRDESKANDQEQTARIDQLEDQIRSFGAEPIPFTVIIPDMRSTKDSFSTSSTTRRTSTTNKSQRPSTSSTITTTSTSSTTTTTTSIRCVGPLCIKGVM